MEDSYAYVPPNDREAEEALLGSLIIDPDAIFEVRDILTPGAFYMETHNWIYDAILSISDQKQPLDLITLTTELRKKALLEDMGGEAYIIGLINTVPTSVNARAYARIVEHTFVRRNLVRAATKIAEIAHDEETDIQESLSDAQKTIFDVGASLQNAGALHIKDHARVVLDQAERWSQSKDGVTGVPTGFHDLDKLLGGLGRGELIVVAGRPGMGKSALQGSIALLAGTKHKQRVGVFSLEMKAEQWVLRLASGICKIDTQTIKRGLMSEYDWPHFFTAIGQLSETEIYIDDTPRLRPTQLRSRCLRLMGEYGLDLVMVDYLQRMGTATQFQNRVHEISYLTKSLADTAKELNIPFVVAAQLSRAVEQRQDKHPQMSDLRDSGNIEEDADVVILMYRDDYYNPDDSERPNICELNVAKNRNGPTGVIDLYWNRQVARFYNLQRQEIAL